MSNHAHIQEFLQGVVGVGMGGFQSLGSNIFHVGGGGGGPTQHFPGVGGIFCIETHRTCHFPGGGGSGPLSLPLDPHMQTCGSRSGAELNPRVTCADPEGG